MVIDPKRIRIDSGHKDNVVYSSVREPNKCGSEKKIKHKLGDWQSRKRLEYEEIVQQVNGNEDISDKNADVSRFSAVRPINASCRTKIEYFETKKS